MRLFIVLPKHLNLTYDHNLDNVARFPNLIDMVNYWKENCEASIVSGNDLFFGATTLEDAIDLANEPDDTLQKGEVFPVVEVDIDDKDLTPDSYTFFDGNHNKILSGYNIPFKSLEPMSLGRNQIITYHFSHISDIEREQITDGFAETIARMRVRDKKAIQKNFIANSTYEENKFMEYSPLFLTLAVYGLMTGAYFCLAAQPFLTSFSAYAGYTAVAVNSAVLALPIFLSLSVPLVAKAIAPYIAKGGNYIFSTTKNLVRSSAEKIKGFFSSPISNPEVSKASDAPEVLEVTAITKQKAKKMVTFRSPIASFEPRKKLHLDEQQEVTDQANQITSATNGTKLR